MNQSRDDRPFQFSLFALFLVVTVACFFFARPDMVMMCFASLATFVFGLACVRGAIINRVSGWVGGLIFGSLFLSIGTVACVWSFGLLVGLLITGR